MSCPRFVVCIDALFVGMTRRTSSCGSWIKSMVGWTNGDSLSDVDLLHSIRVCWFVLRFQLRVAKVTGGAASKLAKIKFVRKSIARAQLGQVHAHGLARQEDPRHPPPPHQGSGKYQFVLYTCAQAVHVRM